MTGQEELPEAFLKKLQSVTGKWARIVVDHIIPLWQFGRCPGRNVWRSDSAAKGVERRKAGYQRTF